MGLDVGMSIRLPHHLKDEILEKYVKNESKELDLSWADIDEKSGYTWLSACWRAYGGWWNGFDNLTKKYPDDLFLCESWSDLDDNEVEHIEIFILQYVKLEALEKYIKDNNLNSTNSYIMKNGIVYLDIERSNKKRALIEFSDKYWRSENGEDGRENFIKAVCEHDHLNYEEKLTEYRENKQKELTYSKNLV